jgi:hypothetical protein
MIRSLASSLIFLAFCYPQAFSSLYPNAFLSPSAFPPNPDADAEVREGEADGKEARNEQVHPPLLHQLLGVVVPCTDISLLFTAGKLRHF